MPGENCCVVNCSTSRRTKGIGIFKIPSAKRYPEWRKEWLNSITKTRVVDENFKIQISNDRVYACQKHFKDDDIETSKFVDTFSLLKCSWSVHFYYNFVSFIHFCTVQNFFFLSWWRKAKKVSFEKRCHTSISLG